MTQGSTAPLQFGHSESICFYGSSAMETEVRAWEIDLEINTLEVNFFCF